MKAEQIVVPVAALVIGCMVGGALGYTLRPVPVVETEESVPELTAVKSSESAKFAIDENANREDLRKQLRELQRQIAKMDREAREQTREVEETQVAEEGRRGRGDRGNWRERMMQEDPARYAAMTNQFAQMQRDRQAKIDFLGSIDTSRMSAADRANTESLQALMVKREELEARMRGENVSWEDRRKIGQEMWETQGQIREMGSLVRDALVRQTATTLGYTGEDAKQISETLSLIMEVTDAGQPGGPGPGGFGGGRGNNGGGRGGFGGGRGGRR